MPLALSIEGIGLKEAQKALAGVDKAYPRAAAEAINRGLIAGRKSAGQDIRKRYNIKATPLKAAIKLKNARWGSLDGSLEAKGPMLPIGLFDAKAKVKQVVRRGPRRQFVTVAVIKGHRRLVKGGFMPGIGGKVFERRQPDRLPIWPVSTIGVPFMIGQRGISEEVQETIASATNKRLEHLVKFYLDRAGGRTA